MYTVSSVYCRIHHIVTTMAKKLLLKTRTPVLQAIKGQREQFPHNASLCDKVQHGTKATFVTPEKRNLNEKLGQKILVKNPEMVQKCNVTNYVKEQLSFRFEMTFMQVFFPFVFRTCLSRSLLF